MCVVLSGGLRDVGGSGENFLVWAGMHATKVVVLFLFKLYLCNSLLEIPQSEDFVSFLAPRSFERVGNAQKPSQRPLKKPRGDTKKSSPIVISDLPDKPLSPKKTLAAAGIVLAKETSYVTVPKKQKNNAGVMNVKVRKDGRGFKATALLLEGLDQLWWTNQHAINEFMKLDMTTDKISNVKNGKFSILTRLDIFEILSNGLMSDCIMDCLIDKLNWLKASFDTSWSTRTAIVKPWLMGMILNQEEGGSQGWGEPCINEAAYNMFCKEYISLKKNPILFPICNASHWHLVVLDFDARKFQHFSSLPLKDEGPWVWGSKLIRQMLKLYARKIFDEYGGIDNFSYEKSECPQQPNSEDCGYYTYLFMKAIIERREIKDALEGRSSRVWRKAIAAEFLIEAADIRPPSP